MGHSLEYGKITEIYPNSIVHSQGLIWNKKKKEWEERKIAQFFSRNEYALKLTPYLFWMPSVAWENERGMAILRPALACAFILFAKEFLPFIALTTGTYYPDSSHVDGYVARTGQSASWSSIKSGAGTNNSYRNYDLQVSASAAGTNVWASLYRAITQFDTSGIDDGATINSATISLYCTSRTDHYNQSISVVLCSPASTTSLANSDYGNFTFTRQATDVDITNMSVNSYVDWTLNSTGCGNISKTGTSKFGFCLSGDMDASDPTAISSTNVITQYQTSVPSSNKPKLVIDYSSVITYTKTLTVKYNLYNQILKSLTLKWTLFKQILKTLTLKWTLFEQILKTLTVKWNLFKNTVKTLTLKYNLYNVIVKSLIIKYNLLKNLVKSFTAKWHLLITLSTASLIDSYSESNCNIFYPIAGGDQGTPYGIGQSFTNVNSIVLDSCRFYLKIYQGSPTGSIVAKIYAHTGTYGTSSVPDGEALAVSDAFNVSALTSSPQLITFNFSGANRITLSPNTYYVVTIEYNGSDFYNTFSYGLDTSSPTHSGNKSVELSPSNWFSQSDDAIFYVYGENILGLKLKWTLFKEVLKPLTLKWNLLNNLQKALIIKWNLFNQIIKTLTLKWTLFKEVIKSLILKYELIGGLVRTLTIKYNLISTYTKDLTLKYDLFNEISKTLTIKWTLFKEVVKSLTLKWTLFKQVLQSLTLKYDLISFITKTLTLKYDLYKEVEKSLKLKWNLTATLVKSLTIKWNIFNQIIKSLTVKWVLFKQITKSCTLKWSLLTQVLKSLTLRYNLLKTLAKSFTLKYHILNNITKTLTIKWNIFKQVLKNLTLKWHLFNSIIQSLKLKYHLFNLKGLWNGRVKPTTVFTKRTKPTTTWTKRTKQF